MPSLLVKYIKTSKEKLYKLAPSYRDEWQFIKQNFERNHKHLGSRSSQQTLDAGSYYTSPQTLTVYLSFAHSQEYFHSASLSLPLSLSHITLLMSHFSSSQTSLSLFLCAQVNCYKECFAFWRIRGSKFWKQNSLPPIFSCFHIFPLLSSSQPPTERFYSVSALVVVLCVVVILQKI